MPIKPTSLRDLCDTLCVPYKFVHKDKNKIWMPFHPWQEGILAEFDARKSGKKPIPTGEYVMAQAINDCEDKHDTATLKALIQDWRGEKEKLSFKEKELLMCAWLSVLPDLEKYGNATNITV